jgi:hypothetical protein
MSDHSSCSQGPRFDSLEEAIKGIHETLKQLTDLLISKAESDTKLTGVIKITDDHETRIRSLEAKSSASQWVERIVWSIVVAAVLAYFNLKT